MTRLLDADARIIATRMQKARWFLLELSSDKDLHDALGWLEAACEAAGKAGRRRR